MVTIILVPSLWSYTNLTPAQLYTRLVNGDTLILLDVREVSEYQEGHIAEPYGQLPLTPVNMPHNSGVLSSEYSRLPTNIDIVVYCQSGGRSAMASSFLDSKDFTRIYNMTGGFSSWIYDYRTNGFGDHSGQWIHSSGEHSVTITCSDTGDTSKIIFSPNALPEGIESIYMELHYASSLFPVPPNVIQSDLDGLFRITVLNRFGLSLFAGDSLNLSDTVFISLLLKSRVSDDSSLTNQDMKVYIPSEGWRSVAYDSDDDSFQRNEQTIRKWYNIEGFVTGIEDVNERAPSKHVLHQNYPNPFNPETIINYELRIMNYVNLSVYNLLGQKVATLVSEKQSAGYHEVKFKGQNLSSGVYLYRIEVVDPVKRMGVWSDVRKMILLR